MKEVVDSTLTAKFLRQFDASLGFSGGGGEEVAHIGSQFRRFAAGVHETHAFALLKGKHEIIRRISIQKRLVQSKNVN